MVLVTTHAQMRLSNRAITDEDVYRILDTGFVYSIGNKSLGYFMGKKCIRKANVKHNLALVIHEDTLISVMHMTSPPKHWVPLRY